MNDTLLKIMEFINNNTLLLIGICVFLILVLIGYLIDNSVKSKRIRKDIKNAAQVPENIKNEIIKEAEEKEKNLTTPEITNTVETPTVENNSGIVIETKPEVNNEPVQTSTVVNNIPENIVETNSTVNNDIFQTQPVVGENNVDESLNVQLDLDSTNTNIPQIDTNYVDPDIDIMSAKSGYSNDKKLSEILNGVNDVIVNEPINDIFSKNIPNIQINTDVDKNDVKIETDDTSDELDRIMKKLSIANSSDEDSYTNIF